MLKKQSRISCFVAGGIVLLLVLIIGGWLFYRALPSVENMVPKAPIVVDLLAPVDGTEIEVGDSIPVNVKAFSPANPLESFELWADGQLFAQENTSGNSASAGWVWQSLSEGVHTLVVRVKDSEGNTGQSQVVIVNVLEGDGLVEVPAGEGQTLNDIGEQYNVPPGGMAESNPGLDPNLPLPGGLPVDVPVVGEEPGPGSEPGNEPPPPPNPEEPNQPINPLVFWFNQQLIQILTPHSKPLEPEITLILNECKFRLIITPKSNNAAGFIVYRYASGDTDFHKIATLGPGQQNVPILFEDTITPVDLSSYMYYVSAFNALGESPSIIASQSAKLYGCPETEPGSIVQIFWEFFTKEPVDQFYCYESDKAGKWKRIPVDPFVFFEGQGGKYQQVGPIGEGDETQIQMQCWGWLGGVLKYLGEGGTKVDPTHPPNEVMIEGNGFTLAGLPKFKPKPITKTGIGQLIVPTPFALREASTAAECASHYGNPLAGLVCNGLVNAELQEYYTLVWEWEPKTCWPGPGCTWVNDIDGYYIYEIDPMANSQNYLKDINNPGQKVTAIPLPWGYRCYGVEAYAEGPEYGGQVISEMATYCPGEPPTPEKMVLTPSHWLTSGGQWYQDGDCDTYGGLDSYSYYQNNGLLNVNSGQILVGSYIVDDDDADCFRKGNYSGAVKFQITKLQPGAVFQKATLRYASVFSDYEASGLATNYKLFCAQSVGRANQDWTGLGNNHFVGGNVLSSYNSPLTPLSNWQFSAEIDVSVAVSNWLKHPEQNHGFIFMPASAPHPLVDGSGTCLSGVDNFQLEISYFVP